jgi:hypothetical protein
MTQSKSSMLQFADLRNKGNALLDQFNSLWRRL